jgi:hypothetical protein
MRSIREDPGSLITIRSGEVVQGLTFEVLQNFMYSGDLEHRAWRNQDPRRLKVRVITTSTSQGHMSADRQIQKDQKSGRIEGRSV